MRARAPARPPPGRRGHPRHDPRGGARRVRGAGLRRREHRSVARRADVDPALVRHYFRDKSELFAAGMIPAGADPAGDRRRRSRRAVSTASARGCSPRSCGSGRPTAGPRSVSRSRAFVGRGAGRGPHGLRGREVFGQVARILPPPDPQLRVSLVASHVAGVLLARHVMRLEPIASMPVDEVVAVVGPVAAALPDGTARRRMRRSAGLPATATAHATSGTCRGSRAHATDGPARPRPGVGPASGRPSSRCRGTRRPAARPTRGRRAAGWRGRRGRPRTPARRPRCRAPTGPGSPRLRGISGAEDPRAGAGGSRPTCRAARRARGRAVTADERRARATVSRCRRRWCMSEAWIPSPVAWSTPT